ncbi:cytochrome c oxidase assembly protein COX16 homolog, mitochondrial isoform X1 [Leuresthes tenuis]|uniref:cytochrome c oxidase assembly protein COX16 homolog, mitochondrial isoform X1 n=1 Tax=Leuresthes tenuis TaxID=355514 RepID=UPI003B50158A
MFNFKTLQKNKTVRYGVPMLLLVVGGSFGLREFTQLRYDAQKIRRRLDPSLEAKVNAEKQSVMLEEEYESRAVVFLCRRCRKLIWMSGRTSVVLVPGRTRRNTRSSSAAG